MPLHNLYKIATKNIVRHSIQSSVIIVFIEYSICTHKKIQRELLLYIYCVCVCLLSTKFYGISLSLSIKQMKKKVMNKNNNKTELKA